MADYSYSDFISKKIVFATSVGGKKPLLKQSAQLFDVATGAKTAKKTTSPSKDKSISSLSIASIKQKKTSSF